MGQAVALAAPPFLGSLLFGGVCGANGLKNGILFFWSYANSLCSYQDLM
jgi:hypothetical protein